MQLAMIGLGRMGANIVRRLMRDGHDCVVYDVNADAVAALVAEGATGADSMADLAAKLTPTRVVWMMVPASLTGQVAEEVAAVLDKGDILIDGGNSNYRDDVRRAAKLRESGIEYVDIGTSGGVFGLERGYCLMVGGSDKAFEHIEPVLRTIAPGVGEIDRTPGREGDLTPEEQGYLHCGPSGAGHFVKMVHNGIEYADMQLIAEAYDLIRRGTGKSPAEIADIFAEWNTGELESYLIEITAEVLRQVDASTGKPLVDVILDQAGAKGTGAWTV